MREKNAPRSTAVITRMDSLELTYLKVLLISKDFMLIPRRPVGSTRYYLYVNIHLLIFRPFWLKKKFILTTHLLTLKVLDLVT